MALYTDLCLFRLNSQCLLSLSNHMRIHPWAPCRHSHNQFLYQKSPVLKLPSITSKKIDRRESVQCIWIYLEYKRGWPILTCSNNRSQSSACLASEVNKDQFPVHKAHAMIVSANRTVNTLIHLS